MFRLSRVVVFDKYIYYVCIYVGLSDVGIFYIDDDLYVFVVEQKCGRSGGSVQ